VDARWRLTHSDLCGLHYSLTHLLSRQLRTRPVELVCRGFRPLPSACPPEGSRRPLGSGGPRSASFWLCCLCSSRV
jgi:hypothetical protein